MPLKRVISLPQAVIYGIGVIVGAGIYTMLGLAAGMTGHALWLSFLIAGIIAGLTAFSYIELTHRYPLEAAESVYAFKAFKNKKIGFFVGLLSLFTGLFSIAAVSWGFSSYLKYFIAIDPLITSVVIIFAISAINFVGIRESVTANNILTLMTLAGIFLIIVFGFRFIDPSTLFIGINGTFVWENSFALIPSLFSAAALIFFAYLGFEEIANISEEIKDAKRNAPKAILYAVIVTTIIYILVSLVAVNVISPSELARAADPSTPLIEGPLALVAEKAIAPGMGIWLSVFALFATAGTILVLLSVSSRILYGMSKEHLLPKTFSFVNSKTSTPTIALSTILILTIILSALGNIELLGNITTAGTFLLFFAVNASLVVIKYNERENKSFFAWMPLPSLFGSLFCIIMFLTQYWQPVQVLGANIPLVIVSMGIFLIAVPLYYLFARKEVHLSRKMGNSQ